jgi:hypothetical protein
MAVVPVRKLLEDERFEVGREDFETEATKGLPVKNRQHSSGRNPGNE